MNKVSPPLESTCKEKIERTLKVVHKHYRKTYTIGFNIQGEYLKRFGFEYGDKVNVVVSKNRILIEKIMQAEAE